MQGDFSSTKTEAALGAYLVDQSCSTRVGGRHDSAASALLSPWHRKTAETSSPPAVVTVRGAQGEREAEGGRRAQDKCFTAIAVLPQYSFPIEN